MSNIIQDNNAHMQPSFNWQNRFLRLLWQFVYITLFRFSPRIFHSWRVFILKIFGAQIGKSCHIYPKVNIWAPWNLVIEDYAGIANDVILYSQARIFIGKWSVISQGSHLCTGTHDYKNKKFPVVTHPITIKNNVWICAESFIHPGVTIHEHAIISARSVVGRDIPPRMICRGNPCKPIKERDVTNE